MKNELLYEIAANRQLNANDLRAIPIKGGFTGATKYVIAAAGNEGGTDRIFAKVVTASGSPAEKAVLDTEAKMYEILGDLSLTGRYFPRSLGYLKTPENSALLIDYLADVTWGGPWNQANISKLSKSINAVHNTALTDDDVRRIQKTANNLTTTLEEGSETSFNRVKSDKLFATALRSKDGSFINSRGVSYFTAQRAESIDELIEVEKSFDEAYPAKLILKDLNFGNIAVAEDRVLFVDPVYTNIGNPATDLVVLGVNIVRALPDGAIDKQLYELTKAAFFQDKATLAHLIKYCVACTSLSPADSQSAWMDFQQSCAATALKIWEEL